MDVEVPVESHQADRSQPPVRWWWLLVVPAFFVAIVGGGAVVLVSTTGGGDRAAHAAMAGPLDLDTVSGSIAAHYRYAEAHDAAFAGIPCFCGCEEFLAHRHLYDCFVRADGAGFDSHAAGCGVCIGEAAVAARLLDEGVPAAEVARRIVEQFGSTPTTAPDQTVRPT